MTLQQAGVKFVAADLSQANNLTICIIVLVEQQEAETMSDCTQQALQAAKKRGAVLGNPNGAASLFKAAKGNVAALSEIKGKADRPNNLF